MGGKILVGSGSWADKTLIDSKWYPPEAKSPEDRLRYYAGNFPIVEVDSTFYAIPLARNGEVWAERTPPQFTFDVKSYALFTLHGAAVQMLPKEIKAELPEEQRAKKSIYYKDLPAELGEELWRRFLEVLLPMDSAGKLGVVLFQFPPWFGPRAENRDYILEAKQRLGQYRLAVEFRNRAWMESQSDQERTLAFLKEHGITYVCVDEPQGFKTSVPPVVAATTSLAVLRMHGHNAGTWTKRVETAAERFDYLYSADELRDWAPRIERLAEDAREVHVLMNNCHQDYSVRNAREIGDLLGVSGQWGRVDCRQWTVHSRTTPKRRSGCCSTARSARGSRGTRGWPPLARRSVRGEGVRATAAAYRSSSHAEDCQLSGLLAGIHPGSGISR